MLFRPAPKPSSVSARLAGLVVLAACLATVPGYGAVAPHSAVPDLARSSSSRTVATNARLSVPSDVRSDRRATARMTVTAGRKMPRGRVLVKEGARRLASAPVKARRHPSARVTLPRLAPGRHVLRGVLRSHTGKVMARTPNVVLVSHRPPVTVPTPTPTTDPTPTSDPTTPAPSTADPACSTNQVWQQLDSCGWPGPATTGHPDGQTFSKTVTGGLVVTADNTVIDGYKISGGIQVRAKNVTIRNSWVTNSARGANGSGVVTVTPGASATIERNLLDGLNDTHTCIWHMGSSMTARRNECTHVNDGIFSWAEQTGVDGTGDNFTIENNWLHAFTTQAGNGHIDGYQTEGAKHGVIRHNTIDVSQGQNAAIAIWNGRKSSGDILIENNLLAGGGFNVYAEDYSPSEASPAGGYSVTNVRFVDNKFSNVHYGCVGYWGVWYTRGAPTDGWRRSGNVLLETNANLDASNPKVNGSLCN